MQELCKRCPVCQVNSPLTHRPPLKPVVENDFLSRVQLDLIDMRHCKDGEYEYIGHFEDHFTKFTVLFPLKTKTADEVSTMLEERVVAYFGLPKIVHSNGGREFVSLLKCAMFARWGGDVTFINGRPRHSQSRDRIERSSRTVEDRLKALKKEEGLQGECYPWASWLPRIMWAMNSQRRETVTDSPYHMVFRKQPPARVCPVAEQDCDHEEDSNAEVHITTPSATAPHCRPTASPVRPARPGQSGPGTPLPKPRTKILTTDTPREDLQVPKCEADEDVPRIQSQPQGENMQHTSVLQEPDDNQPAPRADNEIPAATSPSPSAQASPLQPRDSTASARQTAIRKRALNSTYSAAAHTSNYYYRKKRRTTKLLTQVGMRYLSENCVTHGSETWPVKVEHDY